MALYLSPVPIITDEYWSKDETMSAEESKKYRCSGTRTPLTPQTNNVERVDQQRPSRAKIPNRGKRKKMKTRTFFGLLFLAIILFIVALVILGTQPRKARGNTDTNVSGSSSGAIPITLEASSFVHISTRGYITVTLTNNAAETINVSRLAVEMPIVGIGGCCDNGPGITVPDVYCVYTNYYMLAYCTPFDMAPGQVVTMTLSPFFNSEARFTMTARVTSTLGTAFTHQNVVVGYPTPQPTATPNFWETPTATPPMLTIRAWLPYSIR